MMATEGLMDAAREFIRAFSTAHQTFILYPDGHPDRREAVSQCVEQARTIVERSPDIPALFVARQGFYLGTTLLARESLTFTRLLGVLEKAEIEAIEFLRGVGDEDIDALLKIVLGEGELDQELQGITINRVKPQLGPENEREIYISRLLRTYAAGLELLRQTGSRVGAGEEIDLDTATALVEQIASQVVSDPAQALLVTTVKSYDDYLYYHMTNVCLLSVALGFALGLEKEQVVVLGIGGLLHDIGKVLVPRDVLNYPGALDEEQWRLIQRHPVDGAGLLFATTRDLLHPASGIVLEHHASYDLSGYPGLSGRAHPTLPARIVSVTDCFDAITTKRSYREADDRSRALNVLKAGSGSGYDPRIVRAMTRMLGVLPIGTAVRLGSGETAIVVDHREKTPMRPVVRVVMDKTGAPVEPEDRDLATFTPNAEKGRVVATVDPVDLGIDMATLLLTGKVEEMHRPKSAEPGLVHEPAFGEPAPPGFTHDHDHHGPGVDESRIDPEVAPPFEG
jgi:HD-GYP domain-containing protein (c-di-GMP phosphodiesterase class II)